MKQLSQNKQEMYYALFDKNLTEYARDPEGEIIYTEIGGVQVPAKAGVKPGYSKAVWFKANIGVNGGETKEDQYGLNVGDYDAIISAEKGKLPFTEQTLIWHKSEVGYDLAGNVIPETADYRVVAIKTSLNEERFILKKRVEGNATVQPPSA